MPDGLKLGSLVLEWGRLSFVIGVFAFSILMEHSKDPKFKQVVFPILLAYVIAGRFGYALELLAAPICVYPSMMTGCVIAGNAPSPELPTTIV